MANKIARTIKSTHVQIKAADGTVLKDYHETGNVDKKKVALAYIKETGDSMFSVELAQIEQLREIDFDVFMAHSKVIVQKTPEPVEA